MGASVLLLDPREWFLRIGTGAGPKLPPGKMHTDSTKCMHNTHTYTHACAHMHSPTHHIHISACTHHAYMHNHMYSHVHVYIFDAPHTHAGVQMPCIHTCTCTVYAPIHVYTHALAHSGTKSFLGTDSNGQTLVFSVVGAVFLLPAW